MPEDAACHEAWQEAIEAAGSCSAIDAQCLQKLVEQGPGIPLKYRHICWPAWLQRHSEEPHGASSVLKTTQAALSEEVRRDIQADMNEIPLDVLPSCQHELLAELVGQLA